MPTNFNNKTFIETLSSLAVPQQRRVASRFIEKVLDIADERCLDNIVKLFSNQDISAQDLEASYRRARSIYVDTHPHSDLSELNFLQQAKHFVAEACMTCVAPVYEEAKVCHLAQKVAMYCRMARAYANMDNEENSPDFSKAEESTKQSIEEQYAILQAFLNNK
jgi:dihydroorotase